MKLSEAAVMVVVVSVCAIAAMFLTDITIAVWYLWGIASGGAVWLWVYREEV